MMYYRIYGKAVFPEGIAPGDGKGFSNMIIAARNGENKPLLRGTSIAGALRNAILCLNGEGFAEKWFGRANGEGENRNQSQDSLVYVADMPLDTGAQATKGGASEIRTHNANNRHTGSVIKGGLFSLEAFPPETSGDFLLYVKGCGDDAEDENFFNSLSEALGETIYLGGNRNRGIGRLELKDVCWSKFNTENADELAKWLDVRYSDREGKFAECKGEPLEVKPSSDALVLNLNLQIPRGEDFVIGYGTSIDNLQSEPQFAVKADGKRYWRIPGSSFRGVFRSWMTRLAAREGNEICDSSKRYVETKELKGDTFIDGKDVIMDLFGSLSRRGRIHFSDAYSEKPAKDSDTQLRMHVAVDRFSGGINEGALFGNKVLVHGVTFKMQVSVEKPSSDEKRWLLQTFKAMNLGIICFGTSKASGLLEIANMAEVESLLNGGV